MFDFTDRIVMIAGPSGNLGQAVVRAFEAAGARLVLLDRAPDRLPGLFPDLAATTAHLLLGAVDATDVAAVEAAVQQAVERMGRVDVLVNTVGGYRAGTPVHETPVETWDFMLNLNARPAFVLSRAVVPVMLTQGGGKIVHVAARAALKGGAKAAAYSASKSAVVRLVESLAAELRRKNINVNCVLPGVIDTPQNRQAMPQADYSRWVPPEAIADVILFLASDAAWPVNGAAVPVYGQS
ncbi:MAG TPA: SDR family NAD(P)-dependent oxidoreductase [Anaerolineae bacterium]|nr:SDR family NAD(P)-dependent oxidoreductase [Anaerolineae bacterium]